jgi:hypothetical protein
VAQTRAFPPRQPDPPFRFLVLGLALGLGLALAACGNDVVYLTGNNCQSGYQDNDHDGSCAPSCDLVRLACPNGYCSEADGAPRCVCNDGYVDDGSGNCLSATPGSCDLPIPLPLEAGSVQGTTAGQDDDSAGSCQSSSSSDVVYHFELAGPVHVRFRALGYDTALYLRTVCAQPSSELACADDGPDGIAATLAADLPAGSYYLFVDGKADAAGPYTLTIELSCPPGEIFDPATSECQVVDPSAQGDTCAAPRALPATGAGVVSGTTTDANPDYEGSCAGTGPERVYAFTLAETARAEFLMTGYDTVLYLRTACEDPGSELACNDDSQQTSAGLASVLAPGSYYLFADSYAEGGSYQLHYGFRLDPCAGDPCPGTPTCVAKSDWSGYECVCPPGTLVYQGSCVDDPCDPNLCAGGNDHRSRCQAELATSDYSCLCNIGYIEDPGNPTGPCIENVNAKDWAFFVFLNGDNNLEPNAYQNLEQMKTVGSTAAVDIVVLLDSSTQDGGNARKLYVTHDGTTLIEDMGEVDMGDWSTLADFGAWAVQAYPARHQALILWDHGDGWRSSPAGPTLFKGFSNDDHGSAAGISISNGDYARALGAITNARGDKLDLVGFDACLMAMWEVASATAPYAYTFVGSEETEPADGWRYDLALAPLVASPQATAVELGVWIADSYHDATAANSTISVLDLNLLPGLNGPITAFADALLAAPSWYDKVELARQASQAFYLPEYVDLWDLTERVRSSTTPSPAVVAAADALLAELGLVIVHNQAQSSYPGAHGLSIYLPARHVALDPAYGGAGALWSQATTWDQFLQSFGQ